MSGCLLECESVLDLGPPPDLMPPPPPIPTFLREPVAFLVSNNGSCDLCGWAHGDDVQLVEVIRKYPVLDDVWYILIVSAAVGAILIAVLILIAALRCKEGKVEPDDSMSSNTNTTKINSVHIHESGTSTEVLGPINHQLHRRIDAGLNHHHHDGPKTLWSSLHHHKLDMTSVLGGSGGPGSYVLQHHIINPDNLLHSPYEKIDYGSIDYSQPMIMPRMNAAPTASTPPPPPPLTPLHLHSRQNLHENGVHLTAKGHAYYANPDSVDGSFDNNGFVDSEANPHSRRHQRGFRRQAGLPSAAKSQQRGVDHLIGRPKMKLPHIQSIKSGSLDHLVIHRGHETSTDHVSHLPLVTQLHPSRKDGLAGSTAVVLACRLSNMFIIRR